MSLAGQFYARCCSRSCALLLLLLLLLPSRMHTSYWVIQCVIVQGQDTLRRHGEGGA